MTPPLPGQAIFDCRYWGVLKHEPLSADWKTITSDLMYDQSGQDEFGQVTFLEEDRRFTWIQVDCRKCTDDTNIKLIEAVGPFDSVVGTFTIPKGDIFEWGENGSKGPEGRGVRAIALTLAGGATLNEQAPILAGFDDD